MPGCQGTGKGPCPYVKDKPKVYPAQGELWLCSKCDSIPFPKVQMSSETHGPAQSDVQPGVPAQTGATAVTGNKFVCSDILCYIQNRMSSTAHNFLVKEITDFYSEECIEKGKKLLFYTCQGSSRFIKRKRTRG